MSEALTEPAAELAAEIAELEEALIAWRSVADDLQQPPEQAVEAARRLALYRQLLDRARTRLSALRRGDDPCF